MSPAPRLGSWVKLPGTESVEILAATGADFVVVDLQNSTLTLAHAGQHAAIARALGIGCLVRVPEQAPSGLVGQLFDAGAAGVIVPHVESVDQARGYVDAAFFPPAGTRGMGGTTRGGNWLLDGLPAYLGSADKASRTPTVSIMIESAEALDAVEKIARLDGLGQLFVGPADLSVALGVPGQLAHQRVLAAMDRVIAAARAAGVSAATATGTATSAIALAERGFDEIVISNDASLLASSARTVFQAVREPS